MVEYLLTDIKGLIHLEEIETECHRILIGIIVIFIETENTYLAPQEGDHLLESKPHHSQVMIDDLIHPMIMKEIDHRGGMKEIDHLLSETIVIRAIHQNMIGHKVQEDTHHHLLKSGHHRILLLLLSFLLVLL